jgi:hypothetical protein
MEKLIRNYENQAKRANNANENLKKAGNAYRNAMRSFINKYHVTPQRSNELIYRNHPNVKQNYRRIKEAIKVSGYEASKLRRLHNQIERVFHIPRKNWNLSTISRQNIHNLIQPEKRRQNITRALFVLKNKNVPVNLIRHMFPKK